MGQVASDKSLNVSYNGLTTTDTTWNHDTTTLTPAAEAVIGLVVAIATAGVAFEIEVAMLPEAAAAAATGGIAGAAGATGALIGTGLGLGTGTLAATVGGAILAAGVAGVSSVISGSIIGVANNDFNLGTVLSNAGISMLTAGLTFGVNSFAFGLQAPTISSSLLATSGNIGAISGQAIFDTVGETLLDSGVQAGVGTLDGGNFGTNFVSDLRTGAATNIVAPIAMAEAGNLGVSIYGNGAAAQGSPLEIGLHAIAGAGIGALMNGAKGAAGGALGGALGEAADNIPGIGNLPDQNAGGANPFINAENVASIIGGVSSVAAGDSSMAGSTAAVAGVTYNDVPHRLVWAASGAAGGGYVVSAACDVVSEGVCIPATPATMAVGTGLGFVGGYLAGGVADGVQGAWNWATGSPSNNTTSNDDNIVYAKPPTNAWDPAGAKAPGYPGGGTAPAVPDNPEAAAPGYVPPKGGPSWVPNPNGSGSGWVDASGDVWVPTGQGGLAHGGPHWDVQTPGGGYRNVYPPKSSQ
jgi:hypothetical protein